MDCRIRLHPDDPYIPRTYVFIGFSDSGSDGVPVESPSGIAFGISAVFDLEVGEYAGELQ